MRLHHFSAVAAIVASMVMPSFVEAGDQMPDHSCTIYQACRHAPPCPTVSGECDSCTTYNAYHEQCTYKPGSTCFAHDIAVGGCGFKREGTCGADNVCDIILTSTACDREDCD